MVRWLVWRAVVLSGIMYEPIMTYSDVARLASTKRGEKYGTSTSWNTGHLADRLSWLCSGGFLKVFEAISRSLHVAFLRFERCLLQP